MVNAKIRSPKVTIQPDPCTAWLNAAIDSSEPDSPPSYTPLTRITNAVRVQMIIVSMKVPSMATVP